MSKEYTRYDWASDRFARTSWVDEEDRLMAGIDRRMRRTRKMNKKNHRKYA